MTNSHPLAVFSPLLGNHSETFIRRHLVDLLPGKTAVVSRNVVGGAVRDWGFEGPVFDINSVPQMTLRTRWVRRVARVRGVQLDTYSMQSLKYFLVRNQVQAMLCEYLDHSVQWIELARQLGIRMYAHAHGYDVSIKLREPKWIEAYRRLDGIDGVITVNSVSKTRLIALGIRESLINVIPCGVHLPSDKLEYSKNKNIRCIAVGRMTGKKAPIYLLEAFRNALEIYPNLTLDYVGDGELMPAVLQYVEAFKLGKKVRLLGSQANSAVQVLMSGSDIFLQHSIVDPVTGDEEGLPVAILEAMAHGLPVVTTNHAGIPDAVKDGDTGYLVEEGEVVPMAERIIELAGNPLLRETLGKSGRRNVKEKFTWENERTKLLQTMELA